LRPWPAADDLPDARADAPAPPLEPPPRGEARLLRGADAEGAALFAAVRRDGCVLVTGLGRYGCSGAWQAVHYPSPGSAAGAYARTCARLVASGYHDS
jgi:hypothetical protein